MRFARGFFVDGWRACRRFHSVGPVDPYSRAVAGHLKIAPPGFLIVFNHDYCAFPVHIAGGVAAVQFLIVDQRA